MEISMNPPKTIQRNETITFIPKFAEMEIFADGREVVIKQEGETIKFPLCMVGAIVKALQKAGGVHNE